MIDGTLYDRAGSVFIRSINAYTRGATRAADARLRILVRDVCRY